MRFFIQYLRSWIKHLCMKRLFLFLFFINIMHLPVAAGPDKDLVVITSDATSRSGLKSIRRITFENGVMLVDMKDGSSMNWNTDWVSCVMFGENAGPETSVAGVLQSTVFTVTDNVLQVDCCKLTRIQLCACDGNVVYDGMCSGEFSFDMKALPAGIYLLKLDGATYKILNR